MKLLINVSIYVTLSEPEQINIQVEGREDNDELIEKEKMREKMENGK
jgi:hypothetical protein